MDNILHRARNLVPQKETPMNALDTVLNLRGKVAFSNSISDIIDHQQEVKREREEMKRRVLEEILKRREHPEQPMHKLGAHIDTHKSEAEEAEDEVESTSDSLIWRTVKEIGGPIVKNITRWMVEVILEPICSVVLDLSAMLIDCLWEVLIDGILIPVIEGSLALLVANPVTALIIGIGLVGFAAYEYFKPEEEAKPKGMPDIIPDSTVQNVAQQLVGGKALEGQPTLPTYTGSVSDLIPTEAQTRSAKSRLANRSESVKNVLNSAADLVGVPRDVMTAFAGVESDYNSKAGVSTTSAKGLFQFIDSTWKTYVKKAHDYFPTRIPLDASIYDPTYNAIVGAVFLKYEVMPAIKRVKPNATAADYYFGHFLGGTGGAVFIKNLQEHPSAKPATDSFFSSASAANATIFYSKTHIEERKNKDGKKVKIAVGDVGYERTYSEIYSSLGGTIQALQQLASKDESTTTDSADRIRVAPGVAFTKDSAAKASFISQSSNGQQAIINPSNAQFVNISGIGPVKMQSSG